MKTYNAIVRNNAELHNEVPKTNLTAPEILILRKIHGNDAVVKIEPSGEWEDHMVAIEGFNGETVVVPKNGVPISYEGEKDGYSDEIERERLAYVYGDALLKDGDGGIPRNAIDRMFGEYAPLPTELPDFKKQQVKEGSAAPKPASKKGNLDKVA